MKDIEYSLAYLLAELKLLKHLTHRNISKLYDIWPGDRTKEERVSSSGRIVPPGRITSVYVVMELMETDLKKLYESPTTFNEDQVKHILYQILKGCEFMHKAYILHRDLKPANILLDSECNAKVCDFGLARSVHGHKTGEQMLNEDAKEELSPDKDRGTIMERLKDTRKERKHMKRELSPHVVTRWYRSPELILMEKDYGRKIDVWSVGAIFAEMLTMMEQNDMPYNRRKPFFPGRSCYPLSPDKKKGQEKKRKVGDEDQLNIIIQKIGPLTEDDMSFLSASKQSHYLKQFEIDHKGDSFEELFPWAEASAIDLLKKMLNFNPYFRPSVAECLEHEYFDDQEKYDEEGEIDPDKIDVQFENLPEKELRRVLDEMFEYYNENRDKMFGLD